MDVLIVDDDKEVLEQSKTFLERIDEELNVDTSISPDRALERLEKGSYDAIISDYKMTPKDGLEFLRDVRDVEIDIPFLIFTGKGEEKVAMEALNLGADRYIRKEGDPKSRYKLIVDSIKQEVKHYKTKKKLEVRKNQFEKAIEEAPYPVILHREDGNVISLNSRWTEITGYSEGEISTIDDWIERAYESEEKKKEIRTHIDKLYGLEKRKNEGVFRITTSEGNKRYWEFRSTPIGELPDGRKLILSVANDITEEKEIKDKLKIFKEAVDASTDAIGLSTPEGVGYYQNETFEELFGDVGEDPPNELYVNEEVGRNVFETLMSGEEWTGEVKMYGKKDEVLDIYLRGYPIFEDGEIVSLVGIHTDITDRKKAERELKRSQERYRAVVEGSPYGVVVYNDDGLQFINSAGAEILGMEDPEDYLGESLIQVVHPDYREVVTNEVRNSDQDGEWTSLHEEKFIRLDNNEVFDVEVSGSSIKFDGKESIMAIFRDITERKEAKEKLKKSLNEKELLLSEIHHRVKNNLQVISSMLKLQAEKEEDEKVSRALMEGEKRIISMAVIHEMLYQEDDMAYIDLSHYVDRLVKTLYRTYDIRYEEITFQSDLENIKLNIDQAIPCGLIINEIVTNVLLHAFPEGYEGEKKLEIYSRLSDENIVELILRDTGKGMSTDLDFDENETFGLHLVKILVEDQLEGDLKMEKKEKGTEFKIEFEKRELDD